MTTNQIEVGRLRLTVLTSKLIRIEYITSGMFENGTTQIVQHRDFEVPPYTVLHDHATHVLEVITTGFHLYYDGGDPQAGNLYIDAAHNYGTYDSRWYCGTPVGKNLGGTVRTLDKVDGTVELSAGLMSKNGISVLDDSASARLLDDALLPRQNQELDLYYFAYGRDYRATLQAYYQLTGYPPLIPRYALGNWWSRYYPYRQNEYLALMHRFDDARVPIAVAVLDMDWHQTEIPARYGSGWTGYSWNAEYFPNPGKLLQQLHAQGRHVTLNVHPAAGIRPHEQCYLAVAAALKLTGDQPALFNLQNAAFKHAYFKLVHHPLEAQGVDFWWLDWQQGRRQGSQGIDPLWLLNVAHYDDNAQEHHGQGLILSRYAGPGSHRYPVGFSGDTIASWASLQFQPYFTATATNIGYTWWSHDIGGHMHGTYDGELALRWLQLGVFSPILRLHSSRNPFMSKEPWRYAAEYATPMIKFLQLRHQLLPYLATANVQTHVAGQALIEPMYYGHPDAAWAYRVPHEYQFGPAMIVAAATTPRDATTQLTAVPVWLPAGEWYDWSTGLRYHGDRYFTAYRDLNQYPVFVAAGSIVPLNPNYMQPVMALPPTLHLKIFVGATGHYQLIETSGTRQATTDFWWDDADHHLTVTVTDPQQLLPSNRQYTCELVGATSAAPVWQAGRASFDDLVLNDVAAQNRAQLQQRLQFAKLPFDLKQTIWHAYQAAADESSWLAYVTTLKDSAVQGMLTELVVR